MDQNNKTLLYNVLGSMFALDICLRSIQYAEIFWKLCALLNNNRHLTQKLIYATFSMWSPCLHKQQNTSGFDSIYCVTKMCRKWIYRVSTGDSEL